MSRVCKKVPKSCLLVVLMSGIVGLLQFEMDLMEKRVCVCVWESFVLVKECAINANLNFVTFSSNLPPIGLPATAKYHDL